MECNFSIKRKRVERVGLAYLNWKKQNLEDDSHIEEINDNVNTLNADEVNVCMEYLKNLNPKEWKDQDHYAVLGLEKLRINASEDAIRRAHRRMVLQHHPDKRKAKGEHVDTDKDYFSCITKAYTLLINPHRRRAYDSVDPQFDDSLPVQSEIDNNFYEIFNKYFDLNARWSEKKGVPTFGDENSTRKDVERFYSFWYDFKSWREFSYLDEEDKEKGQDRDERRWIEKENKVARIKRKKEEMSRIRQLVDLAYNNDKRIQKFKNEEKEKKLAAKRAKMDAAQAQKAEQDRVLREAQLAKEQAEKAEQKRIEQIRIEKEQMKKLIKKERKILRDKAKECKYFSENDKEMLKNLEGVEKICETFTLKELQELNKDLICDDLNKSKDSFYVAIQSAEKKMQAAHEEINRAHIKHGSQQSNVREIKKSEMWTNDNVQLLIKAVNLFPAGTSQRWDVIATFINQHSTVEGGCNLSSRDILNKAKALQNGDFSKSSLKTQANSEAFESFKRQHKDVPVSSDITVGQYDSEFVETNHNDNKNVNTNKNNIDNNNINNNTANSKKTKEKLNGVNVNAGSNPTGSSGIKVVMRQWTNEEQALLEQAIKTYPISTPDRWDRISECIPKRTKKDCLRRVKELVELVNAKKEAQQIVK